VSRCVTNMSHPHLRTVSRWVTNMSHPHLPRVKPCYKYGTPTPASCHAVLQRCYTHTCARCHAGLQICHTHTCLVSSCVTNMAHRHLHRVTLCCKDVTPTHLYRSSALGAKLDLGGRLVASWLAIVSADRVRHRQLLKGKQVNPFNTEKTCSCCVQTQASLRA
jgi:hypothetical protein